MEAERNRGVDSEQMMVLERATAPGSAAPCSEQNNQVDSITPEPTPATCGTCKAEQDLYILGSGFLCVGCIGVAVSDGG